MTTWCGTSTPERELARMADRTANLRPIAPAEFRERQQRLQAQMDTVGLDAVYLDASSSLAYFTGVRWGQSERMAGALLPRTGEAVFLVPAFEVPTFRELAGVGSAIESWEEHDSPETLLARIATDLGRAGTLGLDPQTPFGRSERIRAALPGGFRSASAETLIVACRSRKSAAEIALMQRAFDITLAVQAATARILRPGITPDEVVRFIDDAHRRLGAPQGSLFAIVLFGPDTAFPHGVKLPKPLESGDTVLVDTGCTLHGYQSDLTRTYVFGSPSDRQRQVWADERAAQDVAFAAARRGMPCGSVDDAVRRFLGARGYGPGYAVPGLPHRTGHGIGLDGHEAPFLVRGDMTPLDTGMCVSIEPMLCLPGEFGVRLEDHIFMTADGPVWFTQPAAGLEHPFAGEG